MMERGAGRRSDWSPEERAQWDQQVRDDMSARAKEQNALPEMVAFCERYDSLLTDGWWMIHAGAPKDFKTEVLTMGEDGVERKGILVPYWCGSDCACTDPRDDFLRDGCDPECWSTEGSDVIATHWKPAS